MIPSSTSSNNLTENEEGEMSVQYIFKQLNLKLIELIFLSLVYKRKINEIIKIIFCENCRKVEKNMKEHVLSKDHFISSKKELRKNHQFCSYYST